MAYTAATTPQDRHSSVAGPSPQDEHSSANVDAPRNGNGSVKADSPQGSTPQPSPPSKPTSDSAVPARLPPGPRAPAPLQTLAWALAPTWVMEQCAKRMGE